MASKTKTNSSFSAIAAISSKSIYGTLMWQDIYVFLYIDSNIKNNLYYLPQ